MSKTVFVGLSGGVDSAVSAALLKQQGHNVVGCFIKIWQSEFIECTWREDRLDAIRVAAKLGIPFREVDFSEEYKKEVVDTMVSDYAKGITPNPDVLCNRSIKFGHFLQWAHQNDADMIATGHYAQITYERLTKSFILKRGIDFNKDQSYFLSQLGQKELARAMFPIGSKTKREVRALAKIFRLPNAEKPDSQGLCFVGDVSIDEFLSRFIHLSSGAVLDKTGKEVGEHDGAALYTVGQRHGFRLHSHDQGTPHFVVSVDTAGNTITVSNRREDALCREILLTDVNWITGVSQTGRVEAQARYRESPVEAVVILEKEVRVRFSEPHLCAPGQSLVLYKGNECLGGGIIRYAP